MGITDMRAPRHDDAARPPGAAWRMWCKRVGWLLLIWTLSVAALGVAAGLMRLFMHALGMR